jgi:hypothetical protein
VAGETARSEDSFGNAGLSTGLWPNGTITFRPGGSGFITSDGALGMKFLWSRGARGKLTISGRRLDADAPALRSHVPCCYGEDGETGIQASYVIFPTPGCWEVTGQVGDHQDARLTFVTKVVKVAEGPSWRLDPR